MYLGGKNAQNFVKDWPQGGVKDDSRLSVLGTWVVIVPHSDMGHKDKPI